MHHRKLKFAIVITSLTFVAPASADIRIGAANFNEGDVCPSTQQFDCAPTNDPRMTLEDNPILETTESEIWSHIGGLKVDRSGAVPARCVEGQIPEELLVSTRVGSFSINYRRTSTNRFGLGADMIAGLRAGGANDELLDRATAGITAAYQTVGTQSIATEAEYWTYKFRNSELSALKGIGSNPIFQRCLDTLEQNSEYSLVIALGGFWIRESSAINNRARALSAGVTAALREAGASDNDIANLAASIANISNTRVSSELEDVFEGRAINFITSENIVSVAP